MAIALAPRYRQQVLTASGLDVVAGLWLLISGWVIVALDSMQWNNWIVGAAVAIIAAVRLGARTAAWLSWVNVVLGVWTIISPWIIGDATLGATTWNNVITGIAIVALAAWSATATNAGRRRDVVTTDTTATRTR